MTSIMEIAPLTKQVKIGDAMLDVYGVSLNAAVDLCVRFPALQRIIFGGRDQIDAANIIQTMPGAVPALIASGCGMHGKPEGEEKAGLFAIETQLDILEAVFEMTMPGGAVPFAKRLKAWMDTVQKFDQEISVALEGTTQPPSNGSLQMATTN